MKSTHHPSTSGLALSLAMSLSVMLASGVTHASEHERAARAPLPKTYVQECAACHTGADRGQFNEDDLRMPPGLSARQRAAWGD